MAQIGLLRLVEIAQQRPQGGQQRAVVPGETGHGLVAELGADDLLRRFHLEAPGAQLLHVAVIFVLQRAVERLVEISGLVQHRLGGGKAAQLVEEVGQPLRPGKGGGVGLAGGDVTGAQGGVVVVQINTGAEVGAPLLQTRAVDDGAGGHHPDDVPLDESLGGGGVLGLLADGHLIALGDKPGDVGVGGVVGDAAHRHLLVEGLGLVLVPRGQRQVQLAGGGAGVGAEHLVKVAQAEEQDRVGILFLDLHILPHHGRQFSHSLKLLSEGVQAFTKCLRGDGFWQIHPLRETVLADVPEGTQ